MCIKRPTRCHLVYLFLLYRLLNMFRATLCSSSGADDLVVFFKYVVVVLSASQWTDKQPTRSDCLHSYGSATHLKNTTKSSAPEDGHKVARNVLSNLSRRNKYTKWHLVGLLIHTELRCTVNHTSKWLLTLKETRIYGRKMIILRKIRIIPYVIVLRPAWRHQRPNLPKAN